MAKSLCVGTLVDTDEGEMLRLDIPWNRDNLKHTLDNCDPEKNSVTLVNGDVCGLITGRSAQSLIVDIGPYTVEIRGGVNLYVSRPKSAGKSAAARTYDRQVTAEVAIAKAAEADKWAILPTALLNKAGETVAQPGDRMEKASLGDMLMQGYTLAGANLD